ncbi:nicotinamide mononucleotide adenylyltransferase [Pycnococcus provasolii]
MTPSPGGAGARGGGARGDLLPSVNVASVPSQVEESWRRLPPSSDASMPIPCRGGETAVLPTSTSTSVHDEPELDVSQLDISALTSPPANGAKCVVLLVLGSFNPPHTWHARLPAIVKDALKAPSTRFPAGAHVVGAYLSPVHDGYGKPGLVKAEHRIAMARLAVAHEPGVGVDTWEATRSQHQRSLAVARALHRRVGDFALAHGASEVPAVVIACGSDLVKSMATPGHWRPEDVQALTSDEHGVVAVLRAGAEDVDTARAEASSCPWLAQAVSSGGVLFVGSGDAASSCVSSTHVRELLSSYYTDENTNEHERERAMTRYKERLNSILCQEVQEYIHSFNLYK